MKKNGESIKQIGQALFIVNRHAKTALEPSQLYHLKNETMRKLIKEKQAKKIGLHYSNNPKKSRQHSVLLVQVGDYYFHSPPNKEDIKSLPHLGKLDESYRNPKPTLSLKKAKDILFHYLHWTQPKPKQKHRPTYQSAVQTPSTLSPFYHKRKRR
ncbi:YkyB family protein [Gracilibacillus sp. S3-1-1]|uniref:YkyB family protein n=1 Tax=Gracilibacillus pellucidus TaxID=3095368 RepID=A0ACC6M1Q1_9BACI|nr:YkyB family protein [Gracilibacillus sp. S3-1-1]MDX8044864.1 YkyB family protein [Gracilibacillus sp. S3-1-1]